MALQSIKLKEECQVTGTIRGAILRDDQQVTGERKVAELLDQWLGRTDFDVGIPAWRGLFKYII